MLVYHRSVKLFYILLLLINFIPVILDAGFAISQGQFFSGYRLLPGYPAVFSLCLILPFLKNNKFYAGVILFLIIAVVLSITRGAWLSLALVMGYLWCRLFGNHKRKSVLIAIAIGLVILIIINIPAVNENIALRFRNPHIFYSGSNYERFAMFSLCWDIFKKYPLTGIGSDNFALYSRENPYMFLGKPLKIPSNMSPHAFFFQLLAENGLLGFLAMISLLGLVALVLFDERRKGKWTADKQKIFLGMRYFYLAFLVHLFFGYVAGVNRLLFAILIGLTGSFLSWKRFSIRHGGGE